MPNRPPGSTQLQFASPSGDHESRVCTVPIWVARCSSISANQRELRNDSIIVRSKFEIESLIGFTLMPCAHRGFGQLGSRGQARSHTQWSSAAIFGPHKLQTEFPIVSQCFQLVLSAWGISGISESLEYARVNFEISLRSIMESLPHKLTGNDLVAQHTGSLRTHPPKSDRS